MLARVTGRIRSRRLRTKFREYGAVVETVDLGADGVVEFARWGHPLDRGGNFGADQVAFFRRWTSPGDLVVDIGAFTGDTAIPMALAVGAEGLAVAVEPNPYVFRVLERNAGLNPGRTNIQSLNFAAAADDGPLTFHYSDASFCNGGFLSKIHSREPRRHHPFELKVSGRNLERYLRSQHPNRLDRLSLIKIDAEGYDGTIIRALRGLLLQYRPYLIAECYIALHDEERQDLHGAFVDADYVPHRLDGFEGEPGGRLSVRALQADHGHYDILGVPRERPLP